jgi:uncharacterized membrane protein YkvA (DUF1232 family)
MGHDGLKGIARTIWREVRVARRILRDPRTPRLARLLLAAGIAYAVSPIDLIPDFVPVLGHLDDMLIVPLLLAAGIALVPRELVREHRRGVGAETVD